MVSRFFGSISSGLYRGGASSILGMLDASTARRALELGAFLARSGGGGQNERTSGGGLQTANVGAKTLSPRRIKGV